MKLPMPNRMSIGFQILLFATIGPHTPVRLSWTILSTFIFRELRSGDGDFVSQHKVVAQVGDSVTSIQPDARRVG